jgi:hypothetical protein
MPVLPARRAPVTSTRSLNRRCSSRASVYGVSGNEYRVPVWPSITPCAKTLWCGHVFANLARQAQFGEFIRHSKRTAGVRLDAAQTVPDGVRVNMELGCGIVGRALVGTPRHEGVEEDIFFFAAQVIELAEDSRATVVAARLSRRVSVRRSPSLLNR